MTNSRNQDLQGAYNVGGSGAIASADNQRRSRAPSVGSAYRDGSVDGGRGAVKQETAGVTEVDSIELRDLQTTV